MDGKQYDVFLAHNSADKPAVEELARELRDQRRLRVWFDVWRLRPGLSWQKEMDEGIRGSNAGAILVGKDGIGPWENEEMQALLQLAVREQLPVIPVLLPGAAAKPELPVFLANRHYVDLRKGLLKEGIDQLVWGITGENPHDRPDSATTSDTTANPNATVDISRIVKYAPERLIGRETETGLLEDSWRKVVEHEEGRPHVLGFVALGGEGKTSLVAKWLAGMAGKDWPGCESVFAWSFYSQGSREQVSSDLFLVEALKFFGDPEMAGSAQGAYEKGQRLAELVGGQRSPQQAKRNLLILDGLEPLQYPPSSPTGSRLKDQGVEALLKGLAASSNGLCIVTSRYSLPDLDAFAGSTWHEEELRRLSRAAGVELLKDFGVKGSELRPDPTPEHPDPLNEYEQLVEDAKGHALTLQILGQYLKRAHHGDIRRRDRVDLAEADSKVHASHGFATGHAFRAIAAYEAWLESGTSVPDVDSEDNHVPDERATIEAHRELAVLRLLGLFDRPATADCVQALLRPPAIDGLTDPLVGLSDEDWEFTLTTLADARLVSVNRVETTGELVSLDAHPLIREYFGERLKAGDGRLEGEDDGSSSSLQTTAYRLAHRRLYEHLCETTNEGDQPTLEQLQALYQAVAHGCAAGLHQETYSDVFFKRIQKGNEAYAVKKLGVFGSELGAIVSFFDEPWNRPSPVFDENRQAMIVNRAAFYLRALGRLIEALEPMRVSGEMDVKVEEWKGAAISYNNLSELELTLGKVSNAISDAERSVTYSDRSCDAFWRMGTRTAHADALHQSGRRSEAESLFREAEQMQAEHQPAYPLLYSVAGFRYCDLLLAPVEREARRKSLETRDESREDQESRDKGQETEDSALPALDSCPSTLDLSEACRAVTDRANKALEIVLNGSRNLLDIALDHLTLSRAALYESLLSGSAISPSASPLSAQSCENVEQLSPIVSEQLRQLLYNIEAAVSGLRRAGQQHFLVQGLLTRAWQRSLLGRKTGQDSAQSDLDEAWEIASRGPMPLFMADIHLHRARLCGMSNDQTPMSNDYPWESVKHDLAEARRLIEKHGYGHRIEELEDAEAVLLLQK